MNKKRERKIIYLNRALIIIAIFICSYTVVNMITIQYDINKKNNEISELDQKILHQENDNQELITIIEEGATDEAIIEVAQDKLGLALPGERVMSDIGSK